MILYAHHPPLKMAGGGRGRGGHNKKIGWKCDLFSFCLFDKAVVTSFTHKHGDVNDSIILDLQSPIIFLFLNRI